MKARLLPYLEATTVSNAFNFSVGPYHWSTGTLNSNNCFGTTIAYSYATSRAINATAGSTTISMFLCPSDSQPGQQRHEQHQRDHFPAAGVELPHQRRHRASLHRQQAQRRHLVSRRRRQRGDPADLRQHHRRDEQHRRLQRIRQGPLGPEPAEPERRLGQSQQPRAPSAPPPPRTWPPRVPASRPRPSSGTTRASTGTSRTPAAAAPTSTSTPPTPRAATTAAGAGTAMISASSYHKGGVNVPVLRRHRPVRQEHHQLPDLEGHRHPRHGRAGQLGSTSDPGVTAGHRCRCRPSSGRGLAIGTPARFVGSPTGWAVPRHPDDGDSGRFAACALAPKQERGKMFGTHRSWIASIRWDRRRCSAR